MCRSVNLGTIQALRAGVVKSTSIMTCCPAYEEFATFAKAHPEFDYGVHLTLTCDLRAAGWGPVLPVSEVPSLVDGDRFFHATTGEVARQAVLAEVEAEFRAQIHKAKSSGIAISHLDHHMWVLYSRPDLLRLYVQLGREFGLAVRFTRDLPPRLNSSDEQMISCYHEQLQVLKQAGLPLLDSLESENYSKRPTDKRAYFLDYFRNLRPGITEFVIHCASPDPSPIAPPDAAARCADTAVFSAQEFHDELQRLRIEIIDWRSLNTRTSTAGR